MSVMWGLFIPSFPFMMNQRHIQAVSSQHSPAQDWGRILLRCTCGVQTLLPAVWPNVVFKISCHRRVPGPFVWPRFVKFLINQHPCAFPWGFPSLSEECSNNVWAYRAVFINIQTPHACLTVVLSAGHLDGVNSGVKHLMSNVSGNDLSTRIIRLFKEKPVKALVKCGGCWYRGKVRKFIKVRTTPCADGSLKKNDQQN